MISVLLADDHPQLMKSLKYLFETTRDIQLVATAKNGSEAVAQAYQYHPDIAILDISMPIMDGLEATRQIRAASKAARVIILSIYDSPVFIKSALDAGASGYVLKDHIANDLLAAIRAIHRGKRYFSLRIAEVAKQYI
jgi:two-component system, NarL family, nitrate/nitrite response regulator NarL